MKRIETLTPYDRLAVIRTLNDAAQYGNAMYSCEFDCALYTGEFIKRSFTGWLAWLCDDVKGERNSSGYRVLFTEHINHFRIVRPDGANIYAVGQSLSLLPFDYERKSALAITDVFASRYGAACILVEDMYSGDTWLYTDIL